MLNITQSLPVNFDCWANFPSREKGKRKREFVWKGQEGTSPEPFAISSCRSHSPISAAATMSVIARESIGHYWTWVSMAVLLRLALLCFPVSLNLSSRPEVATPLTSLRRLAEGYWLKRHSMSPYAGSMYHGSPLLLPFLGPLTIQRGEGKLNLVNYSLLFVFADLMTAILIRAIGQKLQYCRSQFLQLPNFSKLSGNLSNLAAGDIASLVFLWNPLTLITCVGFSTSPVENLVVVLSLYGACSGIAPLAAFGWVMSTHLSLYPVILVVPIVLLLGYGMDGPPKKFLLQKNVVRKKNGLNQAVDETSSEFSACFSWGSVAHFLFWALLWSLHILVLCGIYLEDFGNLAEMFKKTYGFILSVEDLSPNIGVLWYFFAEVFEFFRTFFLMVFHMNILFMVLPLAIRLRHRPLFLSYTYIAISSMLKSYPSVGDSALYIALLALFINEVKDIRFSFLLFSGYVGVLLLSPVMHNLWIWRGTGNANFYFATGLGYACLQTVLIVESVGSMLNHDRMLRKQLAASK